MVLSTVAVALGLAIFAAFWNQRSQLLRHMGSQPERWLQMAWSGDNNRRGVGHVPWEFQDRDDGSPEDDMSECEEEFQDRDNGSPDYLHGGEL
jgi:hypothetical protein